MDESLLPPPLVILFPLYLGGFGTQVLNIYYNYYLKNLVPDFAMMFIRSLSLIGFSFCTGFYSKNVILELVYIKYTISGNFTFWLGSVFVFFTSYHLFRLLF
jgi:NADH:ubiquinone oxidoreductase subunit 5 (subunit L)/multisubunit Na+/H+ antiporter MnhA subunit